MFSVIAEDQYWLTKFCSEFWHSKYAHRFQHLKSADFTKVSGTMRNILPRIGKGNIRLNGLVHFHKCCWNKVGFIDTTHIETSPGCNITYWVEKSQALFQLREHCFSTSSCLLLLLFGNISLEMANPLFYEISIIPTCWKTSKLKEDV